jgi:hypothetical protein
MGEKKEKEKKGEAEGEVGGGDDIQSPTSQPLLAMASVSTVRATRTARGTARRACTRPARRLLEKRTWRDSSMVSMT